MNQKPRHDASDGVARLTLLNARECASLAEQVQSQREHWESRWPGLPFFTLGAASYLDAQPEDNAAYYRKAARLNPLLEREFGWLHERLLTALAEWLGTPADFAPDAARPGFHIFLAHEIFRRPLSKIHFDLQYENIDWSACGAVDFARPLSFTLAIRLPGAGAGLTTWSIAKADYDAMDDAARARLDEECAPGYEAYREGEMVCHSGLLLHRIAPARPGEIRANDMRLTLQGHALPGRDRYWLYW